MIKLKSQLTVVLSFVMLSCFGQVKNGVYESYYSNGNIASTKSYKNNKLNGTSITYFSGGSKKIKEVENYLDGKLHGECKSFFPNGKLEYYKLYENGNRKLIKEYYSDGSILSISNYIQDRQHGEYKRFYPNGQLLNLDFYENGNRVGVSKRYSEKGQIAVMVYYDKNGNKLKYEEYNNFGFIRRIEGYSSKGLLLHEESFFYDEIGNLKEKVIYEKDTSYHITLNKIVYYDNNGEVSRINEKIYIPDQNGFFDDADYDLIVYNRAGKIVEKRVVRKGKTNFIDYFDSNEKPISRKVFKYSSNGDLVEEKTQNSLPVNGQAPNLPTTELDTLNKVNLFSKIYENFKNEDYGFSVYLCRIYIKKYPSEVYGYYWSFRSLSVIDSTMELGLAVQDCEKFISIAEADKVKNKGLLVSAYGYLAGYSANIKKDLAGAAGYLEKIITIDPNNQDAIKNRDIIQKALAGPKK